MPLEVFDTELFGCPQLEGYSVQPQERFRRLQVMNGAPRYRLTQSMNTIWVNLSWVFTQPIMQFFEVWYWNKLESGSLWFLCDLDIGQGTETYECHFVSEWNASPISGPEHWKVTAQIEIRPTNARPVPTPNNCNWTIAGTPSNPSNANTYIAGTPSAIALNVMRPCPFNP